MGMDLSKTVFSSASLDFSLKGGLIGELYIAGGGREMVSRCIKQKMWIIDMDMGE